MVHNCYAVVSGISKYCTLRPGDIILTGTPGAVEQIKHGDVVEVAIPGIGVLRNPVVAEESCAASGCRPCGDPHYGLE